MIRSTMKRVVAAFLSWAFRKMWRRKSWWIRLCAASNQTDWMVLAFREIVPGKASW